MMKKPAVAIVVAHKPDAGPSFKAPEGMELDDKQPGDMIQAVVDLKIGSDGMLMLKKVNGLDVGGGDEKSPDEEQAPPSFADSVMGGPAPEDS